MQRVAERSSKMSQNPAPTVPNPTESGAPISVGTGFLALDLLLCDASRVRANLRYAGGSCGNVLTILSYFDWISFPVARLGKDRRAQVLLNDLRKWSVQTEFVLREHSGVTPAIVVRLYQNEKGENRSRFEWKDPQSGEWLPRYRPLPKSTATRLKADLPDAKVFYFDRAEPSSLILANTMRERGAIIFFEPSKIREDRIFSDCLAAADIVKYSVDRIPIPPSSPISHSPKLEIQTLGSAGLRFRTKHGTKAPGRWIQLPAYEVKNSRDATGCGDWCSAGIILKLCSEGRQAFMKLDETQITDGISLGQALAAVNCEYNGARGAMYAPNEISKEAMLLRAETIRKEATQRFP